MSMIRVQVLGATPIRVETQGVGAQGLSAYQVAAAQGFVGSEDEWLASLAADATALAEGYAADAAASATAASGSATGAAGSASASAASAATAATAATSAASAASAASGSADTAATSASAAAASATSAAGSATTATTKASEAATSAAGAAGSATSAATQATAAGSSATDAAGSATLAQQWATQTSGEVVSGQGYGARKYAIDAAASASTAAGSATDAGTSATSAAGSATSAATSASSAGTSATQAATSAGSAASSATSAATSQSAAASSATSAAGSATSAGTSAADASTSASSASTSASNAATSASEAAASATNAAASAASAAANTLSAVLTGLTQAGSRTNLSATDTILAAFGKVAKWFADLAAVAFSGAYSDLSGRPTLGTASALNVGTSANNVVQLDGSARLPAVSGALLTNLPASQDTRIPTSGNTVGRIARFTNANGTVAGTTGIYEDASGNVGIGTASPQRTLDVRGTLRQYVDSSTYYDIVQRGPGFLSFFGNGSDYALNLKTSWPQAVSIGSDNDYGSKFNVAGNVSIGSTYDATAAPTNGLIVEGNVGIGTTSPVTSLDVNGPGRFKTYTVATLPAASLGDGMTAFVSDAASALAANLGGTVSGGGSNFSPVYSRSSNWLQG